ncbi:hypothetical protein F4777DRAFT_542194 [Nemania sp. FL0916]|nr:hypothetical protein F4777DRAFT_542194 [Nemania sp. FL0916]
MTYVSTTSLTAIGVIFPVLAIVAFFIRALGWRQSMLGTDDVLIIPAAVLTVATGAAIVAGAQLHIIGGHSLPEITPVEQHQLGKFEYVFWSGHALAIGSIKLSILFLFRRIFKGTAYRTAFDYANWTLIILVVLWTVLFLFLNIFACGVTPASAWESLYSLRHDCIDTFAQQAGSAIVSWILDLAILIEPLFMISLLNMSVRRKIQASLVFLFSIFAVVAGLLRTIIWIQILIQDITRPTTKILAIAQVTADQEGIVSIVLFWTYVEVGVGFLVACLPRCAWLLDRISLGPASSGFGSLPSALALSKRATRSHVEETHSIESRFSAAKTESKAPPSREFGDDVELVTVIREV